MIKAKIKSIIMKYMMSLLRNILFLSVILVSCNNKENMKKQVDNTKTETIEIQNDETETFLDYDEYLWEATYKVIDEVYRMIWPGRRVFHASRKYINNAIKEILVNSYYNDEDDVHINNLLNRLEWLRRVESSDKKLIGYSYQIHTGGTAEEYDIILFYNDKYHIVYDFDEIFPSTGYGLFSIHNIEDDVYLLGVGTSSGGSSVSGGYYCIQAKYEYSMLKLVPKNIFNGKHKLDYSIYIGDYREFHFDENNKTINIRIGNDYVQMKYEKGIFNGDYKKYEMIRYN
jgi:hypothetical protein